MFGVGEVQRGKVTPGAGVAESGSVLAKHCGERVGMVKRSKVEYWNC